MHWHPEKISATGNVSGEGATRMLGKPDLTPLQLLIREAIQNSWDARIKGQENIDCEIRIGTFSRDQEKYLKEKVFSEGPKDIDFKKDLKGEGLRFMIFGDKKTVGLTGPTRADEITKEINVGGKKNFVDFFRNWGVARDEKFGAGTHGFGKSALYKISKVGTIIVYSNARDEKSGKILHRLMAAALAKPNESDTGRHWWGKKSDDNMADPLDGDEAKNTAQKIGIPVMSDDETGTTIMILSPKLEDGEEESQSQKKELLEILSGMAASVYCNVWPKMVTDGQNKPAIDFSFYCEEEEFNPFPPEDHPLLRGFVDSVKDCRKASNDPQHRKDEKNWLIADIEHKRRKKRLGTLVLRSYSPLDFPQPDPGSSSQKKFESFVYRFINEQLPFEGGKNIHHIALMRTPELVIKYEAGEESEKQYLGVFLATKEKEVDDAFAHSEPPAHDTWETKDLDDPDERALVSHAKTKVKNHMRDFSNSDGDENPEGNDSKPLLGLMGVFSRFMPSPSTGPSPPREPREPGVPGPRRQRRKIEVTDSKLILEKGEKRRVYSFVIEDTQDELVVSADVSIRLDDGAASDRSKKPELLYWLNSSGDRVKKGEFPDEHKCTIPRGESGTWKVVFNVLPSSGSVMEIKRVER